MSGLDTAMLALETESSWKKSTLPDEGTGLSTGPSLNEEPDSESSRSGCMLKDSVS